jgi:hypothetical protein
MPPIHPIEAPEGAAHLVGSIYDFYPRYRETEPERPASPLMLDRSFGTVEIVAFSPPRRVWRRPKRSSGPRTAWLATGSSLPYRLAC